MNEIIKTETVQVEHISVVKPVALAESLTREFDGAIFIGELAIFMWSREANLPVEAPERVDFVVGSHNLNKLRETRELTRDSELSGQNFLENGVECNVYVERQENIGVAYSDLAQRAKIVGGVRVADLASLMALKLDSYEKSEDSRRGAKTLRDIGRLFCLMGRGDLENFILFAAPNRLDPILLAAKSIPWAALNSLPTADEPQDAEISALRAIIEALLKLEDKSARERVVSYVIARHLSGGLPKGDGPPKGQVVPTPKEARGDDLSARPSEGVAPPRRRLIPGIAEMCDDGRFIILIPGLRSLKAKSAADAAIRLATVSVYAFQEIVGKPPSFSKTIVPILRERGLYNGYARQTVSKYRGFVISDDRVELDAIASRLAEDFIADIGNPLVQGKWSPDKVARISRDEIQPPHESSPTTHAPNRGEPAPSSEKKTSTPSQA